MKRFFSVALLGALAAVPVLVEAQQEARVGPMARLLEKRAELGLTDQQVAQLQGIQQRLQERNAPLIAQLEEAGVTLRLRASLSPEQREQMRQRRENLTPEQREQMREHMRQRRENLTPEQREQMRQRRENLTPEQREQMRQRMLERRESGEARGQRQIPEELRPVVQELRSNMRAAAEEARAVLTDEQRAKLRELAPRRMLRRSEGA